MRFALGEKDRERFGAPEWLNFDLRDISVADLGELSARFNFDANDWPDPYIGTIALEDAGDGAEPKPPPWRNHALCWMLLRQNGVDASWDEAGTVRAFHIRAHPEDMATVADEAESPGKDPDPQT